MDSAHVHDVWYQRHILIGWARSLTQSSELEMGSASTFMEKYELHEILSIGLAMLLQVLALMVYSRWHHPYQLLWVMFLSTVNLRSDWVRGRIPSMSDLNCLEGNSVSLRWWSLTSCMSLNLVSGKHCSHTWFEFSTRRPVTREPWQIF